MEIESLVGVIERSLNYVALNDDDIFKIKVAKLPKKDANNKSTKVEKILNRELHETTLNHRLAYYLENELVKGSVLDYNVDIEYNRNFGNSKSVIIEGNDIPIRPDILIHKRMSDNLGDNLLVVEAKKGKSSQHDYNKIIALMKDERYLYKFGLLVSYSNQNYIEAVLHFKEDDSKIRTRTINIQRKNNR